MESMVSIGLCCVRMQLRSTVTRPRARMRGVLHSSQGRLLRNKWDMGRGGCSEDSRVVRDSRLQGQSHRVDVVMRSDDSDDEGKKQEWRKGGDNHWIDDGKHGGRVEPKKRLYVDQQQDTDADNRTRPEGKTRL